MKMKSKTLRTLVATAVVVVVAVGFVTNLGIGTISAPGFWDISILCPLGALGTMLASKMMVPRAVISLAIMVLLIILFARAFCGWMCPVPLVQKVRGLFSKKGGKKAKAGAKAAAGSEAADSEAADSGAAAPLTEAERASLSASCSKGGEGGCASCAAKRGSAPDARISCWAGRFCRRPCSDSRCFA